MTIELKRIYDEPPTDDGYRILVDKMWPRGVSKEDAKLDEWLKSVAPSDELRKWFHNNRSKWDEFRKRYLSELKEHKENLRPYADMGKQQRVVLLYSSKDTEHNNAVVLKEYLGRLGGEIE
ncbi:DUF488 domain-containing protein [Idiomarina sp. HP20-50]|uniref:DUF488 domain-containing protein n=1 Tax=Idiomarina sp. HP20-50 TaxID=3070813 RepID=UPI00294B2F55|nr:DUF488 domain-containing protein [Idiomarina sp. HP20-50]MDV6315325.1 DUF488 domain-containing protein [Idiomarina sp. HP20-50]